MTLSPPYAYRLEALAPVSLPSDLAERRKRLAASAIMAAMPLPLSAGDERYAALLFPHDSLMRAQQMAGGMSSCALWALALWRLLGVEAPELDAPYRPGRAVADVVDIATRHGAWRLPGDTEPAPLVGDELLVGPTEHVAVRESASSWVDGGQNAGGRSIARVDGRVLERAGSGWRIRGGRRVIGWVDLAALPTPREAYVPEGVDLTA